MTRVHRVTGFAAAAATAFGLAWLSQVPVASNPGDEAMLRLAWRARPERIEHCVTQSPEALASLPAHMRQTTVCEGINASYRLEVRRDGTLVAARLVEPGGLRRDRPLYVFEEISVTPGNATIRVTFDRVESRDDQSDAEADRDQVMHEAVPPSLVWEHQLPFARGQVRIVSYDPEQHQLFEVRPD